MNWSPSPWFLAETNHLLAACLLVVVVTWRLKAPLGLTLGLLLAGTVLKEFWADFTWLEHDAFLGSVADFSFYLAGAFGGALASRRFWLGVLWVVLVLLGLTVWDVLAPFTEPL